MEFVYENSEALTEAEQPPAADTKEPFESLNKEITKTFDLFQSKALNLWSKTQSTINSNNNLPAEIKSKTSSYLNDLDKELEIVENVALNYATKIGGFLKSTISVDAPVGDANSNENNDEDEEIDENEAKLLFNVGGYDPYTSFDLNNKDYLNYKKNYKKDEVKIDQLSSSLNQVIEKLVPVKFKDVDEFWCVYSYLNRDKEEQDVKWDDDDDEEEEDTATSASEGINTLQLNSVNSSTLNISKDEDEEEEDDDDWE